MQRTPAGNAAIGQSTGATLAADLVVAKADMTTLLGSQEGQLYYAKGDITAAANAGSTVVATCATQKVMVEQVIIESNGATTGDLTSAAIHSGAAAVNEIISAATAAKANIAAADQSISTTEQAYSLDVGDTVIVDLQGTGATAVDLSISVGYRPIVSGGTMT